MRGVESHFPPGTVPTRVIKGAEDEVIHYIPAAITTRFEDRKDEVPSWFHPVNFKTHYLASLRDSQRLLRDPDSFDSQIDGDQEEDADVIFK